MQALPQQKGSDLNWRLQSILDSVLTTAMTDLFHMKLQISFSSYSLQKYAPGVGEHGSD